MRQASPSDIAKLHALGIAGHEFPWPLSLYEKMMHGGNPFWILEQKGTIIAYIGMNFNEERGRVIELCVHPQERRKGYAERLMRHAIKMTSKYGLSKLFLDVRVSNEQAQKLYHKLGFRKVGVREDYYVAANDGREDAYVMMLAVSQR